MKALILITSIFYILGLKISNKIDLIKKADPIKKVIIQSVHPSSPEKTANFNEEQAVKKETEEGKDNPEDKNTE